MNAKRAFSVDLDLEQKMSESTNNPCFFSENSVFLIEILSVAT